MDVGFSLTTQQLTGALFGTDGMFPTAETKFDPQTSASKAFKILSDKTTTHYPIQIYDRTSGDTSAEDAGLRSDNVGLWKPIVIRRNFTFNRKIQFDNSDGDSQVGWMPFIAIGCFPCDNCDIGTNQLGVWDRQQGALNCPVLSYESRMYFKDIVN